MAVTAPVAGIILAAGESTRMGRPKPLLPWFGRTLIEFQIESLRAGGADSIIVVTGHSAVEVAALAPPELAATVENPRYREGKTTSIKAGVRAIPPGASAVTILAVDQPRPPWVVRRVITEHRAANALISSPRYGDRSGHPLLFDATLFAELEALSEETEGLRALMRVHAGEVNWVEFDSPVVRLDLNTPEAYQEGVARFEEWAKEA